MATWSAHQLRQIAEADDLHVSPLRDDGLTYGTPPWIDSPVPEALAPRSTDDGHDPHRDPVTRRRQERRVARACHRRAVRDVTR